MSYLSNIKVIHSIMYGLSITELIFYLLVDKLSQPNMAASSGLSGKMFSLQHRNINYPL